MPEKKKQLQIALVDDHNLFRKGLIKLINMGDEAQRYAILFEAENGSDLKEKLDPRNPPDIIIMDIDMPDTDGYQAVDWLRKFHPDIRILVVSMFQDDTAVIRMLRLGVKGYLSKDIEVDDIHDALKAIAGNDHYCSDLMKDAMIQTIQKGETGTVRPRIQLSEREQEFLQLACTEQTYHQIADNMNLSHKTIDGYRENLFQRFKVKSRVSLVVYALKMGLVELEKIGNER